MSREVKYRRRVWVYVHTYISRQDVLFSCPVSCLSGAPCFNAYEVLGGGGSSRQLLRFPAVENGESGRFYLDRFLE